MSKLIYAISPVLAILTNLTVVFFEYKTNIDNPLITEYLKKEIFSWGTLIAVITLTALYICFFVCLDLIINSKKETNKTEQ